MLLSGLASASAFRIEARTEAQLYSMRSYSDGDALTPSLIPRRRLVQYLGLEGWELITGEPLGFETSLRVTADWGLPRELAARIDGARTEDADLLFANVVYKGKKVDLTARVGRQLSVDLMDFTAFDGASVRYLHPLGFAEAKLGGEVYAGLGVKAGDVLGSTVYQPDGIRESDLRRLGLCRDEPTCLVNTAYAALDDIQPIFGARLLLKELAGLSAGLGFRQLWLAGKTDAQRLALEARWGKGRGLNFFGGFDYDLVLSRLANGRLQGRFDADEFAVLAELMRVTPVLSADSIFAYFASAPRDAVRVRGDYYPAGAFRFYAQLSLDLYGTTLNPAAPIAAALADPAMPGSTAVGGSLGANWRQGTLRANADLTFKTGWGGQQIWLDATGGWVPENGIFTLDARLSFANVQDGFNPRLRGNFFGAQLWGSYFFNRNTRASLVLEENLNPFSSSDFKVFAMLDWKVTL